MKRLLVILFFLPGLVQAQDYQTVRSDFVRFFENDDAGFHGIKIDSAVVSGSDSIFYNYWHVEELASQGMDQIRPWSPSFIGRTIIQHPNSQTTFLNASGDSIRIHGLTPLNGTWNMVDLGNGNYIEAAVINQTNETWLDSLTEVKTISLQAKDSQGMTIPHAVNDSIIKISEELGLLRFPNIEEFPNTFHAFEIKGMENPNRGMFRFTFGEAYSWEVGDEFHYFFDSNSTYHTTKRIRKVVANVDQLVNQRTITLDVIERYWTTGPGDPPWTSFSLDTTYLYSETLDLDDIDSRLVDAMPAESSIMIDSSDWTPPQGVQWYDYNPSYFGDGACEKIGNTSTYSNFGIYEPDTVNGNGQYVHIDWLSESDWGYTIFSLGIGPTYSYYRWNGGSQSGYGDTELVYYKKGSEECGTPFSMSELLSTEDVETPIISIHPNPARIGQTLKLGKTWNQVQVLNLSGQVVLSANQVGQLNTLQLNPGIYFLSLENDGNSSTQKLVVLD